jgi:hypothetical protein
LISCSLQKRNQADKVTNHRKAGLLWNRPDSNRSMWERIHPLLSTIAVASGGAGSGLILLDWILSKEAKKWIEDKVSTAWLWLSYHRTWPLIHKLEEPRAFYIALIFGIVASEIGCTLL